MQHDSSNNVCPQSGFIMNAVVDPSHPPSTFSTCSVNYLNTFMAPPSGPGCLDNGSRALHLFAAQC